MTKLKKQVISVLATGMLLLPTPVIAATTLTISGNGAGSDNDVTYTTTNSTVVVQENNAEVNNEVSANSNTGGNNADSNVGGEVVIDTGDASTDVAVVNDLNSNEANVDCCDQGDTTVDISMNGEGSDNDVNLNNSSVTDVFQDNDAEVDNKVDADSTTGNNNADSNVGGDVSIDTGKADTTVEVYNTANTNSALIGGAGEGEGSGLVDVRIVGNGPNSDNDVELALTDVITVVQENDADVDNEAEADADTGNNNADSNVGGSVILDTGDATVKAVADTAVNFNYADADCGCVTDLLGKIDGNGPESNSDIVATLADDLAVFQGGEESGAVVDNGLDGDADTGENGVDNNVAEGDGDPAVYTGDAESMVDVITTGNVNVFGDFELFPGLAFTFGL